MDEETRAKIKKTVTGILEETGSNQMTEYKIRDTASCKLGLDLHESKYTTYVSHVVSSFFLELKAKQNAEAVADDKDDGVCRWETLARKFREQSKFPRSEGIPEGRPAQMDGMGIVFNSLNVGSGTRKRRSVRATSEWSKQKQQRVKPAVVQHGRHWGGRPPLPPVTINRTTADTTSVPAVQNVSWPHFSAYVGGSGTVATTTMVAPTVSNTSLAPVRCQIPSAWNAKCPAVSMPLPGTNVAAGTLPVSGTRVVGERVGDNDPCISALGALLSNAQDQWRKLANQLGPITEERCRLTDAVKLAAKDVTKWQEKALKCEHEVKKWQAIAAKAKAATGKAESEALSFKSRVELLEVENKILGSEKKELQGQLNNLQNRHNQDAIRKKELLELLKRKDEAMKEQLQRKDDKLRQRDEQIVKLNQWIDGICTFGPTVRDSTICAIQLLCGPLDLVGVDWQCCWNAVREGLKFDVMEPSGDVWIKFKDDMRDKALQPPATPQVEEQEFVSEDEDTMAL